MTRIRVIYVFIIATLVSTTLYLIQNIVLYFLLFLNKETQVGLTVPELAIYPIAIIVYIVIWRLCIKHSCDEDMVGFEKNVEYIAILLFLFLIPKVVNLPFAIRTIVILLDHDALVHSVNSFGRVILDMIFIAVRVLVAVMLLVKSNRRDDTHLFSKVDE